MTAEKSSVAASNDPPSQAAAAPLWCSTRLGLGLMSFFGYALAYLQRYNLSVAIVCMVNNTASNPKPLSDWSLNASLPNSSQPICAGSTAVARRAEGGTLEWSKETQGLVLAAFYWGYFVLQLPGGRLAELFGAKRVIAIAVVPIIIASVTSPVSAVYSPWLLLANRIVIGLATATILPSFNALWARWAPTTERSLLLGGCHAGGQFGLTVAYPLTSALCEHGYAGGWPSVFYTTCMLHVVWLILWLCLVYDSPDLHPRISETELLYLKRTVPSVFGQKNPHMAVPWRGILTSPAFWAILFAHMSYNFLTYTVSTNLPLYMKEVLHFNVESIGLLSTLPLMLFWFATHVSGLVADKLIKSELLSVVVTRKLFCTVGLLLPGMVLLGVGYMDCTQWPLALGLLCLGLLLCGSFLVSAIVNHSDIAPLLAGTLFGMTNTCAAATGIISPYLVNLITKDKTREQWQVVFYITAGVSVFGALIYLVLGRGTEQEWAKAPDHDHDIEKNSTSLNQTPPVTSPLTQNGTDKSSTGVINGVSIISPPISEAKAGPEPAIGSCISRGSSSAQLIETPTSNASSSFKDVALGIANVVFTIEPVDHVKTNAGGT